MNNTTKTTYRVTTYVYGRENDVETFPTAKATVAAKASWEAAENDALEQGDRDAFLSEQAGLRFVATSFNSGVSTVL